tara:strand:+ start:4148 stop:4942 length:795 start_codon:yes stop_codon:yes gene_type:complete
MIECKELGKSYETTKELFDALKEHKNDLISIKKKTIYKSCDKGLGLNYKPTLLKGADAIKGELDDDYYYIAVNTTNILDSHGDLHVKGIWNKSAKEQQGKNYLVADHDLKLKSVIASPKDIELMVMDIQFKSLGYDFDGETEALVNKIHKDKIKAEYKEYLDNEIQASVRMQYVKIDLALNSEEKEDEEEKKVFDANINNIANKENFENIDYFWVVSEAKNVNESSLVLFGSNSATGLLTEPLKDTQKNIEPSIDTQKRNKRHY